ncbi:lipase family protein [Nocardia sp. NBC_01503]|uniref:lipase family protein n=1 Tax=Nocardia sp. NBC_01503 TaxID=2975997 RepID=UPI002E7BC485|nr:lipase family protein [Nocardia sp. NBC_01503]WTL31885.1 lipase family protein [Nocardia sp. NBC_01503]
MFSVRRILAAVLLIGGFAGVAHAQPADPQPSGIPISGVLPAFQQWIDSVVPPPAFPNAPATPLVDAGGLSPDLAALRAATLPTPIGDAFVDEWPTRLEDFSAGQLIAWRDVTATAGPALIAPVKQVVQLKYRTTDSHGAASYAIASLALPQGEWTGGGERPVVVHNLPINSLGRDCNPSYTLAHGFSTSTNLAEYLPPTTQLALLRGYAVLIPDHEGPRMAYAEPFVAGHAVLDSIRAVRGSMPNEFGDSRFGIIGYSGGAIATKGAVKLMSDYAPELADVVVGAAMGGVPADYELLSRSMNANLASGVFMAATFAIGRERPEILAHMNNLAQWIALVMKDTCMNSYGLPGILQLPMDIAANFPDSLHSALAQDIYRVTRMDGMKSPVPLYIYNGGQEFWIPSAGARNLYDEQCALGVPAVYRTVLGEHIIAAFTGFPESLEWLGERLGGVPAPNEC